MSLGYLSLHTLSPRYGFQALSRKYETVFGTSNSSYSHEVQEAQRAAYKSALDHANSTAPFQRVDASATHTPVPTDPTPAPSTNVSVRYSRLNVTDHGRPPVTLRPRSGPAAGQDQPTAGGHRGRSRDALRRPGNSGPPAGGPGWGGGRGAVWKARNQR